MTPAESWATVAGILCWVLALIAWAIEMDNLLQRIADRDLRGQAHPPWWLPSERVGTSAWPETEQQL